MSLDALELQTGDDPRATVIVLHGLGADGNDFVPIVSELELETIGPVRFVFPHAPVRAVTINSGYRMRAWYDVLSNDFVRREDEASLRESCAEILALIEREIERGIDPRRIVLMGFSQGGAMSLLAGLRAPERLAGIGVLSAYLPLADTTAAERSPANQDVPIFQAHGRFDPIVAFERGTVSRDALTALGYAVEWHEYRMEHSVCPDEIVDLNRWLQRVLAQR
jgi:phospholipase/carboxylesterase